VTASDTPTEQALEGIWAKLRRRRWCSGASSMPPAPGACCRASPTSARRSTGRQLQQFATLALLVGLPIVLVTAWYHGDGASSGLLRQNSLIIALLFLLGGGSSGYEPASQVPAPEASQASAPGAFVFRPRGSRWPSRPSPSRCCPSFNMSGDPANEYFSDGISEEI